MGAILQSEFLPLLAWTIGIFCSVQVYKLVVRAAKVRHSTIVERTLPLIPVVVGTATGAAFPHELGLGLLIDNGHHSMHALGAFFGAGVGFASSGVFKAAVQALPYSSTLRDALTVSEDQDGG